MRRNPSLRVEPFQGLSVRLELKNPLDLEDITTRGAGACAFCGIQKTKRIDGYCRRCKNKIMVYMHGGVGAFRKDSKGRIFRVLGTNKRRKAMYCFGTKELPLKECEVSSLEKFREQQRWMWSEVLKYTDLIHEIANRYTRSCDPETLIQEVGLLSAGQVLLTYYGAPEEGIRAMIVVSCTNAFIHWRKVHFRKLKREVSTDDSVLRNVPYEPHQGLDIDTIGELGMSPHELSLLTDWKVHGLTLEQIGIKHGVVKSTVSEWMRQLRKKYGQLG